MSKASLALRNLRAFTILLVVAFHSVLAYLGSEPATPAPFDSPPYHWRAIPILDSERWFGFDLFCASQYVYLMHFMFFMSGLFVWSSLEQKGAKTFLSGRCLRLGVPFVFGVCVLMPLAHYPVYRVTAIDPSWPAFWAHWRALPFWATGQLWFLWQLLLLDLIAAALFRFCPRSGELLAQLSAHAGDHPGRYCAALVAISAVAYIPMAHVFRPWEWIQYGPFALQPSFTLHYAIYFFAGLGIGAYGIERGVLKSRGMLVQRWPAWTAVAFGATLLWIVSTALVTQGWDEPGLELAGDLGLVVACAAMSFALAAVFIRFATARSQAADSLAENAYSVYLLHYVFAIWLQYLLLGFALFAVVKAAIVFAGTLALSWSLSAALCRIRMGALVLGRERVLVRSVRQAGNKP